MVLDCHKIFYVNCLSPPFLVLYIFNTEYLDVVSENNVRVINAFSFFFSNILQTSR